MRKSLRQVDRNRRGGRGKRLAALLAAGAAAGSVQAATITVNSTADDTTSGNGQCTLREALANANGNTDTTGGDCTAGSGLDTIQFSLPSPSAIVLTGGQLAVTDSTNIAGPGSPQLSITGNGASRIFYIYNGAQALDVTISGLTLTQGSSPGGAVVGSKGEAVTLDSLSVTLSNGPAIRARAGGSLSLQNSFISGTTGRGVQADHLTTVSIAGSTIQGNTATVKGAGVFLYQISGAVTIDGTVVSNNSSGNRGGGIALYDISGPITISNSIISANSAANRGGGIFLYKPTADVTISNTTISGNTSSANRGGGFFLYKQSAGTTLTISDSTISGNQAQGATGFGGGIFFYKQSGTTVIENSTISGNTAATEGGGIYDRAIQPTGALVIRNSTINGNNATTDGGNLRLVSFPSATITNTIVANGTAGSDPDLETGASNVAVNYSLIEDTTGATFSGANNIVGVDPQLGPLANNGGPTQTHLPASTSPAINAGDPAFTPPPSTDQRGLPRLSGGRIDIGSVELNGGAIEFSSATYSVNESGGSITITLTRDAGLDAATVNYATSDGSAMSLADYAATSGTATFAAGATTATFTVPIVDDAIYEGNETFNVTLSNPSEDATVGVPATAVVTIVDNDVAPADLSITKSVAGSGPFTAGQPITFNIAVANAGPGAASTVVVTDTLPAGMTLVSATPSQGTCSGTTTITCSIGAIANGGGASIVLTVTPSLAGPATNTAAVSNTSEPDPNGANNAASAAVTVGTSANVPVFGPLGKIAMAALLAMLGLVAVKRE